VEHSAGKNPDRKIQSVYDLMIGITVASSWAVDSLLLWLVLKVFTKQMRRCKLVNCNCKHAWWARNVYDYSCKHHFLMWGSD